MRLGGAIGHEVSHYQMSGLRRELRAPPGCAPGISAHRSAARWRHNRGTGVRVEPEAAISLRAMRAVVFLSHAGVAVMACPMGPLFNIAWIRPRANIHRWVDRLTDRFGCHKCYWLTPCLGLCHPKTNPPRLSNNQRRKQSSALVFLALLPPHPGPLPEGEGESSAALAPSQCAWTPRGAGCAVPAP